MFTNRLIMKIAVFGLLFSLMSMPSSAGTLASKVNRNKISLNETVTLTINYDDQVDAALLDLDVLKSDFEVLSSSPQSNNSVSVINGKATRQASTIWTILLAAKKTGNLTIPSFSIANDSSEEIAIEVFDHSGSATSSSKPLEVWVSTNHQSIVPGQQLIVNIEISAQADIADLNGPQLIVKNADVEPLGQQTFQRLDNGVARRIVVLQYAVFATQTGELTIPIMSFTGIQGGRRNFFGSSGRQVVARTTEMAIKVAPIPGDRPAGYESVPWFPADGVSISSAWSGDKNAIKAGEPITRTITVRARGQRATIIPPLERPAQSDTYKSYKDQPKLDSNVDSDGFISSRIESEAIVALADGELTLPELTVKWWNVTKKEWQTTVLPTETFDVLPAPDTQANSSQSNNLALGLDSSSDQIDGSNSASVLFNGVSATIWQALTALLLLVCLVQTYFLFRLNKDRNSFSDEFIETSASLSEASAWRKLERASTKQDAAIVRQRLLAWTKAAFPDEKAVSLIWLVRYGDDPTLASEIDKLESGLYKTIEGSDVSFEAAPLMERLRVLRQAFLDARSSGSTLDSTKGELPSLYPS